MITLNYNFSNELINSLHINNKYLFIKKIKGELCTYDDSFNELFSRDHVKTESFFSSFDSMHSK